MSKRPQPIAVLPRKPCVPRSADLSEKAAKCREVLDQQEPQGLAATEISVLRTLARRHDRLVAPPDDHRRASVLARGRGRKLTADPTLEEGHRESSGLSGGTNLVRFDHLVEMRPAGVPSGHREIRAWLGRKEDLVLIRPQAGALARPWSEVPSR